MPSVHGDAPFQCLWLVPIHYQSPTSRFVLLVGTFSTQTGQKVVKFIGSAFLLHQLSTNSGSTGAAYMLSLFEQFYE